MIRNKARRDAARMRERGLLGGGGGGNGYANGHATGGGG